MGHNVERSRFFITIGWTCLTRDCGVEGVQTRKKEKKRKETELATLRFGPFVSFGREVCATNSVRGRGGGAGEGERAPVARGPAGARFVSGLGLSPENASSLFLPKTRALSLSRSPELGRLLKGEEVWEDESI